jgi:hypothetical protein
MKREKTIHNIALNKLRADFKHLCFISTAWRTHNSGFKKLAVQWLNEHFYFVSSVMVADSFVLRNRQLLKPANRYARVLE